MNIWRLITHHIDPDRALGWTRQNERIAIGWGRIGDLREQRCNSSKDVGALIRQHYPEYSNSGTGGISLWNFVAELKRGDLVILSGTRPRELVVEVNGDYEYEAEPPTFNGVGTDGLYQHQRQVRITALDPQKLWSAAGARPAPGQNIRQTLLRCALPLDGAFQPVAPDAVAETVPFTPVQESRIESSTRSGRNNKLTGQIGEFLVCAELGRRGFIATPFSGNVPAFDVIATDELCRTVPIQVKASNHDNWPARAQDWMDIELDEETGIQHLRGAAEINNPQLIYVCVSIAKPNSGDHDRFFVLTKSDIQQACIKGYSEWMEKHGWKRPRNTGSFDCRYFIPAIEHFEDNWGLIAKRIEETSPGNSLNIADE